MSLNLPKIKVTCPQCGASLGLTPVPGYHQRTLRCPQCQFTGKYSLFASAYSTAKDKAPVSPVINDQNAPTQVGNDSNFLAERLRMKKMRNNGAVKPQVKLYLPKTDQTFDLKEGSNIIGRKSSSSFADIAIEGDPYMSRRHVDIQVIKQPDGTMQYRLNEINSTNIVKLNGREIHRNDILVIRPGDELTLGQTSLKLIDCDQTLIL